MLPKAVSAMREKKEINIQLGKEIRTARERCGMTQEQLAEILSLGPKNISDIERGVAGITVSTLKNICVKLSISSDIILFGDGEKNDAAYLVERLERLSPEQFKAVADFLNEALLMFARLGD